jgi:uncharacterized protein (TIGR00369 family)
MRKRYNQIRLNALCELSNMVGLQIRFYSIEANQVVADYVVNENYQGYPGVVHGGIVAAMLDEAAGRSLMQNGSDDGEPRFMYTARLDIRYRQNVPVGQPLHIVGKAGKVKGRTATAQAQIQNSNGVVLAEAEALLVNLPESVIASADLESLGWRIYPDERDLL